MSKIDSERLRVKERRLAGLCIKCADPALPHSKSFCEKCWLKNLSKKCLGTAAKWEILKNLYIIQQGKCAYTNDILIFGWNASIDHIKSISRFPELKFEPSNLQWTTLYINKMKREFDDLTFRNICELVTFISKNKTAPSPG